jgi:hypothetical protein
LLWRWRISSVLATKKACGSMAAQKLAQLGRTGRVAGHQARLEQRGLDRDVLGASARHWDTVRTLEPISSPVSQQLPMKVSMRDA